MTLLLDFVCFTNFVLFQQRLVIAKVISMLLNKVRTLNVFKIRQTETHFFALFQDWFTCHPSINSLVIGLLWLEWRRNEINIP
jgi:hypothetical protein